MAVNIELKRSSVPGKIPASGSLNLGELAINTADGAIYFVQQSGSIGNVLRVATTTASGSTAVPTASYANYSTGTVKRTSPYQFVIFDLPGGKVLYTTDDNTIDSITERGIVKYSLVGGTWKYNGSMYASGARGLTGYNSGDTVALFATSSKRLFGAKTFSTMTLSLTTVSIMTLSIMTLSIMTLSNMTAY